MSGDSGSAPIVIVYEGDITYNDVTATATESNSRYDKLTYELLLDAEKQNELKYTGSSKPNGPIDRILVDLLGLKVLYGFTFILCDLYRTWKTGQWTSLMWMFLGPWNALTGAPLIHKLTHVFDHATSSGRAINLCESKYFDAKLLCSFHCSVLEWSGVTHGDHCDACLEEAEQDYRACYEATPEYKDCVKTEQEYIDDNGIACPLGSGAGCVFSAESDCLSKLGYDPK